MSVWLWILFLVTIVLIGLIRCVLDVRRLIKDKLFAESFLIKFCEWTNSRGESFERYNWMLAHSEKMQAKLGGTGILAVYRAPYNAFVANNFAIILNLLPELNRAFRTNRIDEATHVQGEMVDGCLRRYIGSLDNKWNDMARRIFNPIAWFFAGTGTLLRLPLMVLNESKIISNSRSEELADSRIFAFINFFVTLATFISSIIAIVKDWNVLIKFF